MVHKRIEPLRREDRVDQAGQFVVVERDDLGTIEQPLQSLDAVAPRRSLNDGQHRHVDAPMCVPLVQDGVQTVRDEHETMVLDAAVQVVVVAHAHVQSGLVVQQERIDRDVPQPLAEIDDFFDLLQVRVLRSVVEHVHHVDQVRPVVLCDVVCLEIAIPVHVGIGAFIAQFRFGRP